MSWPESLSVPHLPTRCPWSSPPPYSIWPTNTAVSCQTFERLTQKASRHCEDEFLWDALRGLINFPNNQQCGQISVRIISRLFLSLSGSMFRYLAPMLSKKKLNSYLIILLEWHFTCCTWKYWDCYKLSSPYCLQLPAICGSILSHFFVREVTPPCSLFVNIDEEAAASFEYALLEMSMNKPNEQKQKCELTQRLIKPAVCALSGHSLTQFEGWVWAHSVSLFEALLHLKNDLAIFFYEAFGQKTQPWRGRHCVRLSLTVRGKGDCIQTVRS